MANDEWGDFQTPAALATHVFEVLGDAGWTRLLEPTCGTGRFLSASVDLGPEVERLGIETQPHYVREASDLGFAVLERNIFDLNLGRDLEWKKAGALLVVGNPPWVTSAQLGSLRSINLPAKSNIRNLRGFDAMTGASNFDIAEYIFLKLMIELQEQRPTIALLVKTQVARNVLAYAEQFALPYAQFEIRLIDAKKWFGASVEACLFTVTFCDKPRYMCDVYPDLESRTPSHTIGVVDNRLVSDVVKYRGSSFADGMSPVEWRSGVKHDASRVMEISDDARASLGLEDDYVFPLLKCTDLFRGRLQPSRCMIIPQRQLGEQTEHLRRDAPRLWAYLEAHAEVLDSRASSIYRSQPRFAVFGLGEYSFAPYKIAVSGLHKEAQFVLLGQHRGRPIVVDDASYIAPFDDGLEAALCWALLRNEVTTGLLDALVFWDAKRPINKKLLQRIDLAAVAAKCDAIELATAASDGAASLGLAAPPNWSSVLDRLQSRWETASQNSRSSAHDNRLCLFT